MPIDQDHCRDVFKKLTRELSKVTRHSTPERVHKYRTSARRVETVLEELVPRPDRNIRKLLKLVRRQRKKAGKVRDLDVHISALRNLKIARGAKEKSQLLRALLAERVKREKKLSAGLDKAHVQELRQRLKRASKEMQIPRGLEPSSVALEEFSELARKYPTFTQKTLHQYRIMGKRARYLLEMASRTPQEESLMKQFEKMQDLVGDWHDWLTLTERAERLFGGVKDSPLVAATRNLTRAKFREATGAASETKSLLSQLRPGFGIQKSAALRKLSATAQHPAQVAA